MLLHFFSEEQNRPASLRNHFELALAQMAFAETLLAKTYDRLRMQFQHREAVKIALALELCAGRHSNRIERIFQSIGVPSHHCEEATVVTLTHELETMCASQERNAVRDAVCIALVQRILHQKIACYGTLRAQAITFREEEVVTLLESSLEEEKSFDRQLTVLSRTVNDEAANKEY
jgi:ferritin-like metal-binding protein YciE